MTKFLSLLTLLVSINIQTAQGSGIDDNLFNAIASNNISDVKASIALGANPKATTKREDVLVTGHGLGGWRPMYPTYSNGEHYATGVSALAFAVSKGNFEIVEYLLNLIDNQTDKTWVGGASESCYKVQDGAIQICDASMISGGSPSPIEKAILVNSPAITRLLVAHYSNVGSYNVMLDSNNRSFAVELASLMGREEIVSILMSAMRTESQHIKQTCGTYYILQREGENDLRNHPPNVNDMLRTTQKLCLDITKNFKTKNPFVTSEQLCSQLSEYSEVTYRPFFLTKECIDYFSSNIFKP